MAGERLFIGLRGPVLRGWAVILEVELMEETGNPSILRLKPTGTENCLYRKHFLPLGGLGIRDLCSHGTDLLILAGPTMDLDGPVNIFRWRSILLSREEPNVLANELVLLGPVPYGQGDDHAEGLTLFSQINDGSEKVLVVYDSASDDRKKGGNDAIDADVFLLP